MNANKSNRTRNLILTASLVAIVIIAFGMRFQQLGQGTAHASIRSVQDAEGIPVETVKVERGELSQWITLAGTVEGTVQFPIVSNNALRVVGLPFSEGDQVQKGDVIIRLATDAPSPMFHSVDKSRANYENVLVNVKRLRNLYAAGAVSQSELDAAETSLKVLAADLQDAEGSTALIASDDGVITSILVSEGETVSVGKPLAWVADTSDVVVKFTAGSRQALVLAEDQLTIWTAPDGSEHQGLINKMDLMADPKTHLLAGEASFANPDGILVPGLLVSFKVRTHHRTDTRLLPSGCLIKSNEGDAVWAVDQTATLTPVKTGLTTPDQVEILDGLQEGQSVVLSGQSLLSDGVLVKVIASEEDK
jgi:RND family efflux transporter MFP subunit